MSELLLVVATVLLATTSGILAVRRTRRRRRADAESLYLRFSELFRGECEYAVVSKADFPGPEPSGYEAVRELLLARGFRYLGSFENLTVTRVFPDLRTRLDSYVGADGVTTAMTCRVADQQLVNVASVLEGDRFVLTTNAELDKLVPPPELSRCVLPGDTSVEELLRRHQERIEAIQTEEPTVVFQKMSTLADDIAASQRLSRIVAAYRRTVGYLTRDEMLGWATRPDQRRAADALWQEFRRMVHKPPSD